MWWEKLKSEILDTDLYSRSGTEVGVSEGALELKEVNGDFHVVKKTDGDIPEVCFTANSDRGIDYPALNRSVFGKLPDSWLIGNYKKIFIGQLLDQTVRENASSGGIVSGAQKYLLEKGKVDGVITLRMRGDKPYLAEPIIATTEAEILAGAQSKYTIAPVNQILSQLPGPYSSVSYTGLPEQIAAVRKLQAEHHPSVKNISYVFGVFYGEILGFGAIKSFLRSRGVRDLGQVASLHYRAGQWPGNLQVKLKDGRIISAKKFHANYLIPSHITPFSLCQIDYTSELADISAGDAWAPSYERRGEGWSSVIARTQKGLDLLEEMEAAGRLYLKEISFDEFLEMHSHGIDFKKRGAFIRIEERRKKGLPVPDYGYHPTNISSERVKFEKVLAVLFALFQNKTFIWFLEKLPTAFIGWFFIHARNIWKKRTKPTKNSNLNDLTFIITSKS